MPNNQQQHKEPNPKVNINHTNYAKGPPPNDSSTRINSKSIPYRSENSLHSSSMAQSQQNNHTHLRPSNIYSSPGSTASSSSTPNLSQMQLSPNQIVPNKTSSAQLQHQQANSRFSFNGTNRIEQMTQGQFMITNFHQRPPLSAPPIPNNINNNNNNINNNNFIKKQMSPYHTPMMQQPPPISHHQQQFPSRIMNHQSMNNASAYYGTNNPYNIYNPMKTKSAVNGNANMDEVDGNSGNNNMWQHPPPHLKSIQQQTQPPNNSSYLFTAPKEKFIRSDSILATNQTDETYENFTSNGKYGAIGIKSNNNALQNLPPRSQWSGLQDSFTNLNISNGFDIAGSSNNSSSSIGGNALKLIESLNKNEDHHYGLNGNFLNIHVS